MGAQHVARAALRALVAPSDVITTALASASSSPAWTAGLAAFLPDAIVQMVGARFEVATLVYLLVLLATQLPAAATAAFDPAAAALAADPLEACLEATRLALLEAYVLQYLCEVRFMPPIAKWPQNMGSQPVVPLPSIAYFV